MLRNNIVLSERTVGQSRIASIYSRRIATISYIVFSSLITALLLIAFDVSGSIARASSTIGSDSDIYRPMELTQCDKEDFGTKLDLISWGKTGKTKLGQDWVLVSSHDSEHLKRYEYRLSNGPEHLVVTRRYDTLFLKIVLKGEERSGWSSPKWLRSRKGIALGSNLSSVVAAYGTPSDAIDAREGQRTSVYSYFCRQRKVHLEWTLYFLATDGIITSMGVTVRGGDWAP
jgi:hypothetical protein